MASGHGGPRQPANPAPVSGPGALSQRTDGKQPIMDLPDAGYGQNAQFRQDQAGAPLPQSNAPATAPTPGPGAAPGGLAALLGGGGQGQPDPGQPPLPLSSGTMLPDQPVTHGADAGPGADSSSLNLGNPIQTQHASALTMIQQLASNPTASPALRFLASSLQQGF